MKRIIATAMLGLIAVSIGVLEPVDEKPVLKGKEEVWMMYGKPVARYQVVINPDGSRVRLKAPDKNVSLLTAQWQATADKMWEDRKNEPKPEICPTCGGEYWP